MIDRSDDELQLVCDETGIRHRRTYDREDFDIMIADAKDDGWKIVLENGRWRHYSPECRTAEIEFEEFDDID